MSNGMFALASDGSLLLHTDSVNSLFYKNAGTYTATATLPAANFLKTFGIATPINPVTWQRSVIKNRITVCGAVSSDGDTYHQPSANLLACDARDPSSIPYPILVAEPAYVHSFGTLENITGFGFSCKGPSSLAVSPSNRAYCVHPTSTGSRIRSATATTLDMPDYGVLGNVSFTQPTGPNIIFDQAYINPPLIFITQSSGPIAFNFMNRDANGRYVSASIVAASSLSAPGEFTGLAFFTINTYTFSYFIVSDEPPIYGATSSYGVRVFDEDGNKTYDSTNFMPSFFSLSIAMPYVSLDADRYYRWYNGASFTKSPSHGVCINSLNAFTGYAEYPAYYINSNGGGPISFTGRYLQVTSTTADVAGNGTVAFGRGYLDFFTSFDFIRGSVPNMNVLFASHYL